MPTWSKIEADSLENFIIEINRRLDWILSHLNSKNVKSLNTTETTIKSANGETEIKGSQIIAKDELGTIRFKQGLNPLTATFEWGLYNKAGTQTVGIDSDGNAVFEAELTAGTININNGTFTVNEYGSVEIFDGTLLITRADNLARVKINAIDGFKLQKGDGTGLDTSWTDQVYFDANGDAVIKGIIRTAEAPNKRIELANNQFRTYNNNNYLNGFVTNNADDRFGDVEIYDGSVVGSKLVFSIVNNLGGVGVSLQPKNNAALTIGAVAHNTRFFGNVAGMIWRGTQAEADAKTDWIDGQYADITDETLPVLNAALNENLSTVTATDLNNTNKLVNQIRLILIGKDLAV